MLFRDLSSKGRMFFFPSFFIELQGHLFLSDKTAALGLWSVVVFVHS